MFQKIRIYKTYLTKLSTFYKQKKYLSQFIENVRLDLMLNKNNELACKNYNLKLLYKCLKQWKSRILFKKALLENAEYLYLGK